MSRRAPSQCFLWRRNCFFQAVDERRAGHVFFADAADREPPVEVVGKEHKDHGKGVRKVWHDKIRRESVGLSAGALHAWDFQAGYFRLSIGEGDKAAFIAAPFFASSFRAAVRAG